jgi:hypothetical protein
MTVTNQQLAQLLLGIARAQQAIIDALENSKAGFKSTHFRPSIETASRLRSNRAESLADFPSRLLLQMMSRAAPDTDSVIRDLEKLLAASDAGPPAATVPAAPSAAVQATALGNDSLDMTK